MVKKFVEKFVMSHFLRYIYIIYIGFLWSISATLYAQSFVFEHLTPKDGLSSLHTREMLLDKNGYVWIATNRGVSRIAGNYSFVYDTQDGIPYNDVSQISMTSDNTIWGISKGELFSIHNNQISSFQISSFQVSSFQISSFSDITDITEIKAMDNQLYFYSSSLGLGYFDGKKHILSTEIKDVNDLIPTKKIIYLASKSGFGAFIDGAYTSIWDEEEVYLLYKYGLNIFFVGNQSIWKYNKENSELRPLPIKNFPSGVHVYDIHIDHDKDIWLATAKGTFIEYEGAWKKIDEHQAPVYDILEDYQKCIWLTTEHGVYRLEKEKVLRFDIGSRDMTIQSLSIDSLNDVLYVTVEDSVYAIREKPRSIFGSKGAKFNASLYHNNKLYVGGEGALYVWDGKDVRRYGMPNKKNLIRKILWHPQYGIMLAGDGIKIFKEEKGETEIWIGKEYLGDAYVTTMLYTKKGLFWIGTSGGGIYLYENAKLKNVNKQQGLVNTYINDLTVDTKGHLWIATSGNGMIKIRNQDLSFGISTFDDLDLNSTNIYTVYTDEYGHVWAGGDHGVDKLYTIQNDKIYLDRFTHNIGLDRFSVGKEGIIRSKDHTLYIASSDGLIKIENMDDSVYDKIENPKVFIHDIKVLGKPLKEDMYLNGSTFNFSSEQSHIGVSFHSTFQSRVHVLYYQWKLEGYNDTWSVPQLQNNAVFPFLSSGNYTFKVRACTVDGHCSSEAASVTFNISKPFYQHRLFIVFIIAIIVALVVFYVRKIFANLQASKDNLDIKVRRRTLEIEEQNTKLTKILSELDKQKDALASATQELMDSLEYAKHIQDAVIVSHQDFYEAFPSTFAYAKPKEVVISDFYWVWKKRNITHVVLVDCDAKGVPGGFLSLIASEKLKLILSKQYIADPASLLYDYDKALTSSFKNSETSYASNAAICKIDAKKQKMTFSSANLALIYEQNDEFNLIYSNELTLGRHNEEDENSFTNYTVALSTAPQTCCYLFSDGCINQLNEEGEEYGIDRLFNFLKRHKDVEYSNYKTLLTEELNVWRGEQEQTDDMLIIGFKYERNPDS